jgi:hypothetical protein
MLGPTDKQAYRILQRYIESLALRTSRRHAPANFRLIIQRITQYAIQNNENDWKRSLVCGVVGAGDDLAVSTTQLTKLIGKCKSWINSGFQSIGFAPAPMTSECAASLARAIPLIRADPREPRKWTLRVKFPSMVTPCPEPEWMDASTSIGTDWAITEQIMTDDEESLLFALGV